MLYDLCFLSVVDVMCVGVNHRSKVTIFDFTLKPTFIYGIGYLLSGFTLHHFTINGSVEKTAS